LGALISSDHRADRVVQFDTRFVGIGSPSSCPVMVTDVELVVPALVILLSP
jgi:hypothetical protein